MQWIRSHLSFANLVSLMALFIALGGTTYAAVTLPKNSVGAKQIKKNGVSASEIKRNAVGASEIRPNAVASGDIADNGVAGADLSDNSVGAGEVADGSLGATDLQAGLLNFPSITAQTEAATVALANNSSASYTVTCPAGQQAIGGGGRGDATDSEYTIVTSSRPVISTDITEPPVDGGTFTGWRITVLNPQTPPGGAFPDPPPGGDILPAVWAFCAPAS